MIRIDLSLAIGETEGVALAHEIISLLWEQPPRSSGYAKALADRFKEVRDKLREY